MCAIIRYCCCVINHLLSLYTLNVGCGCPYTVGVPFTIGNNNLKAFDKDFDHIIVLAVCHFLMVFSFSHFNDSALTSPHGNVPLFRHDFAVIPSSQPGLSYTQDSVGWFKWKQCFYLLLMRAALMPQYGDGSDYASLIRQY